MQKPLISILIPFKNTEDFIDECLDSIINQAYSNWELLIVNDHSTDTSNDIVKLYTKKDPRIQLFQNSGNGIINALRLAFNNSSGMYITRMDSDDIMHPEKLETLLHNLLINGKTNIAIGKVKYFSALGIKDGYARYETWLNNLTKTGSNYTEVYKECVIPSPCWMLHRDDLLACNAFKPNRYPEDYDLAFRFYEHNYKVIPCNKTIHFWRDHEYRASRTDLNYAENSFLDIKLHYFLKLNRDVLRPLVIWGAGRKGKDLAQKLLNKDIDFTWICDNPKKIGKAIYGKTLKNFKHLVDIKNPQSIITVANIDAQREIINFCKKQNMKSMIDYFFFC